MRYLNQSRKSKAIIICPATMVLQWKLEIDKWCGRTFDWSTPEIAAGYYGCTVEDQIHRFRSASIEFVRHLCTVLIFVSLSLSLSLSACDAEFVSIQDTRRRNVARNHPIARGEFYRARATIYIALYGRSVDNL